MKSSLVIKLIESHCEGSEDAFKNALNDLADDEENKGNGALSFAIRNAYSSEKKTVAKMAASPLSEMTFSVQRAMTAPRDRDSTLELIEILNPKVRLSDVALPEKTKDILHQIIEEQKKAESLLSKKIMPTNRILLCGPPGCGKTLTANAIASEIGIPVAYVKLDGLISSYLGQTGTNIRKIFDYVKNKRIVLFLDEFDAIAKKRDDANELGEMKRVVMTLLQNMDAMPANVFLIAATNHHHLLDSALWRRFDISLFLELPNTIQRGGIIRRFLSETLPDHKVDAEAIVKLTEGMSGAQICNYLQMLAKHHIMRQTEGNISEKDIADMLMKQTTLFAGENSKTYMQTLAALNEKGVSLRLLEDITGIPRSTLSYNIRKMREEHERTA